LAQSLKHPNKKTNHEPSKNIPVSMATASGKKTLFNGQINLGQFKIT
jgi:hypothetical protein